MHPHAKDYYLLDLYEAIHLLPLTLLKSDPNLSHQGHHTT